MDISAIENILQQLIAKPIGTKGVALVSAEGQSIVPPVGIDENATGILAGTMLRLLRLAQEELHWQQSETVSVRGQEGYLLLKSCGADVYLLIKSEKVPVGLLEGEVNRAVDKLRSALTVLEVDQLPTMSLMLEPGAATLPRPDSIPSSQEEDNTQPSLVEALDWTVSDSEISTR
jgi:predicted regulator of Ras-like GTPase activity (Roadblock/LC7/MglB family)